MKIIKQRIQSFSAALAGIRLGFGQEIHLKIQLVISILVVILGIVLDVSTTEWIFLILCMTLVISFELINSAIERLADKVTLEKDPLIKSAKDMAAGAVLFASICSFIIGCIIFIPKFIV